MDQQNIQPRNINGRATARVDAANRPGGTYLSAHWKVVEVDLRQRLGSVFI